MELGIPVISLIVTFVVAFYFLYVCFLKDSI